MVPDRLFSVGFLRALRFPPTAIRQMVKGLWDWIWLGSSTLEFVKRWRLSAKKSRIGIGIYVIAWRLSSIKILKNYVVTVMQNITYNYILELFLTIPKVSFRSALPLMLLQCGRTFLMRCVNAPLSGPFGVSLRHISSTRHTHLSFKFPGCSHGAEPGPSLEFFSFTY